MCTVNLQWKGERVQHAKFPKVIWPKHRPHPCITNTMSVGTGIETYMLGRAVQSISLLLLLLVTKMSAKPRSLCPAGDNEADPLREEETKF